MNLKSIILLGCLALTVACTHSFACETEDSGWPAPPPANLPRNVVLARSRRLKEHMTRKEVSSILGLDLINAEPAMIMAEGGVVYIELYRANDKLCVQLVFSRETGLLARGDEDLLLDKPEIVPFNLHTYRQSNFNRQ